MTCRRHTGFGVGEALPDRSWHHMTVFWGKLVRGLFWKTQLPPLRFPRSVIIPSIPTFRFCIFYPMQLPYSMNYLDESRNIVSQLHLNDAPAFRIAVKGFIREGGMAQRLSLMPRLARHPQKGSNRLETGNVTLHRRIHIGYLPRGSFYHWRGWIYQWPQDYWLSTRNCTSPATLNALSVVHHGAWRACATSIPCI